MVNVIGVRFENAGKLYFFTPGALCDSNRFIKNAMHF